MEVEPKQYHTELNHEGHEIVISFMLAPPCEDQEQLVNNAVEVEEIQTHQKKIISQYNIQGLERDLTLVRPMILKQEVEWLPFQFNLGGCSLH